jgi:hypothetical protein
MTVGHVGLKHISFPALGVLRIRASKTLKSEKSSIFHLSFLVFYVFYFSLAEERICVSICKRRWCLTSDVRAPLPEMANEKYEK